MRILFIHAAKEPSSSPEYHVHHILADHVDPRQCDCSFIWQTDGNASGSAAVSADPARNAFYDFGRYMGLVPRPSRYKRAWMMARQLPGALLFVMAQIRKCRPDVIYTAQQRHDVRFGRLFSRLYGIPHLIHIHYPLMPALGKDVVRAIYETPYLIAVSEFIRRDAIANGIDPRHIRTVHNPTPFEPEAVQKPAGTPSLRAQFNLPANAPLVVAAGRLDPSKGHRALFAAFARVHAQVPEARLLVCGASTGRDGYEQELHNQAKALGDYIQFAGYRRDLPNILAAADLFCLPTEREAFGLVFLEAMSAGLPVVAVDSGGVPEIVQQGETGFLVAPGDIDGLAARMITLLTDPEMAHRFGAAGQRHARTEFAPGKIAALWADVMTEWFGRK